MNIPNKKDNMKYMSKEEFEAWADKDGEYKKIRDELFNGFLYKKSKTFFK